MFCSGLDLWSEGRVWGVDYKGSTNSLNSLLSVTLYFLIFLSFAVCIKIGTNGEKRENFRKESKRKILSFTLQFSPFILYYFCSLSLSESSSLQFSHSLKYICHVFYNSNLLIHHIGDEKVDQSPSLEPTTKLPPKKT